MEKTCTICRKKLVGKTGKPVNKLISHGVCEDCLAQLQALRPQSGRQILNSFGVPILLLDNQSRIIAANDLAKLTFKRTFSGIENHLPGEVLECINARMPGGCGKTAHCQACALKKALAKTLATGEGMERVPAYQDVYQKDGSITRQFLFISTEKLADVILLRIDEIETFQTIQKSQRPTSNSTV